MYSPHTTRSKGLIQSAKIRKHNIRYKIQQFGIKIDSNFYFWVRRLTFRTTNLCTIFRLFIRCGSKLIEAPKILGLYRALLQYQVLKIKFVIFDIENTEASYYPEIFTRRILKENFNFSRRLKTILQRDQFDLFWLNLQR